MIDYKSKFSSVLIFLEKSAKVLWKYLSFSLADNFFSIAKIVSISIETDGIYIVVGTKIFWKTAIQYFKKFPWEEDKALTPEYLAAAVSKALDETNTARAFFVLSIPRAWTIVQVAEFPVTVKENLANVISYELDRLTPLTPENACYDYKMIDETSGKIKVLLTVAKADKIKPFLEVLRSKNINIEKVSISSLVIKKLIKDIYNIKNSIFISVNDKAYECGAVINDFTVRSISGHIESLDDSRIHQIIKEILSFIDLLPKSGAPVKIIINSDEKCYKTFSEKLSKFSIANLNRDIRLRYHKGYKDISPFALGNFLETVTADQNEFNLLAGKNGKQKKRPFVLTAILSMVILLIGVYYVLSPIMIEQKNIEQIDNKINSLKPEIKKIEALKQEMEMLSSDIKTINDFKKQSISTIDILKEITKILPATTWLTRLHVTGDSVEIEGYAASATAIISKLENSKYFQKAEFASPTFRDPRQNNERFIIKMELKNENKPKKPEETGVKNEKRK